MGLAVLTTFLWGAWGAGVEWPERAGFPPTLGYVVWALTFLPIGAVMFARRRVSPVVLRWDSLSVLAGLGGAFLACGGNLLLFLALVDGPAHLVFPIVSIYPAVTVVMSVAILGERARRRGWLGIALALGAVIVLSAQGGQGGSGRTWVWLWLSVAVCLMWGLQAFLWKLAERRLSGEALFVQLGIAGLALAPVAMAMTDWTRSINWGWQGPALSFPVQALNSIGALAFVHALQRAPAMLVVPLTGLAPFVTAGLSLALHATWPTPVTAAGIGVALLAGVLMST